MNASSAVARRRFMHALAVAVAGASFRVAAQGLSKRTVRIVVPFTPGTGPDIVARLLGPKLQTRWEQPFFVENRPGASGTIGAEIASKAPPDGHTIMVGPASALTAPHLYKKLAYDVIKDFAPITNVGSTSLALVVHKSLRSFAGLAGPVMVVGARQRLAVWARDRWDGRMDTIPEGPDTALRQAARDLKL